MDAIGPWCFILPITERHPSWRHLHASLQVHIQEDLKKTDILVTESVLIFTQIIEFRFCKSLLEIPPNFACLQASEPCELL
jgi:hypothetical protein